MTSLQLLGLRLIAYTLIAVGLFGYGYVKGLHRGEAEKDLFIAQEAKIGAQQEASNAKLLVNQKEVNQDVKDDYTKRIVAVTSYYANKLQHSDTSSSKMSTVANNTKRVDATTPEPTVSTRGPKDSVSCISPTSAALDALQVLEWQSWAKKQGFIVDGGGGS